MVVRAIRRDRVPSNRPTGRDREAEQVGYYLVGGEADPSRTQAIKYRRAGGIDQPIRAGIDDRYKIASKIDTIISGVVPNLVGADTAGVRGVVSIPSHGPG